MGAVLVQVQVCYVSRTISRAQSKYSPTRRELLALVTFTRNYRPYLLGRKFTIVTDHSALQYKTSRIPMESPPVGLKN